MSAKLDKSLDEILSSTRQQRRRQRRNGPKPAPAGGVKKQQKAGKQAKAAAPAPAPVPIAGDSKIIVSGLVRPRPSMNFQPRSVANLITQ